LILIVTLTLFACQKDTTQNFSCNEKSNSIDLAKNLLPGSYAWAYTRVTFQGGSTIETPASTGLNYKYVFNKNGKVYYYENDILKSIDSYIIDYEFKVTAFPSDSATIVIIKDMQTGQRKDFFRTYLCSDSALFYNPYNSIDFKKYFKRN
jgi:hypothetical protein